ncbi:MAG TPA: VWA domain-containing protein [Candidatus Sumerlaeota bacterium]|nr:VWA domain-containing protein [Candidatus Sumerlaeota bacterium]
MLFDSPKILFLIPVALAGLVLFFWWASWRRRRLLERFGQTETVGRLLNGVSGVRRFMKHALLVAAVLLLLFSLARPQYGTMERPLERRGVEVLIAVDCSTSMLGQDMKPNRLGRAREQLRGLIQGLEGDNVGIIAFAGVPIVQCPMTPDYDMALNLLDSLDVDSVPVQGTAIARAIRKAIETFKNPGKGQKVLVLLTDGEDHEQDVLEAARDAAKAGIVIHAIGIGSPEGVPIPMPQGGYKEFNQAKVNTRLDFQTLTQVALETGGKAIKANEGGDLELDLVLREIRNLKQTTFQNNKTVMHVERFQYFLLPAILALLAEMFLGDRRRGADPLNGRLGRS